MSEISNHHPDLFISFSLLQATDNEGMTVPKPKITDNIPCPVVYKNASNKLRRRSTVNKNKQKYQYSDLTDLPEN